MDCLFGDPEQLPHPVVYFGRWISFWEKCLNRGSHRKLKGALFAFVSVALVFLLTSLFLSLVSSLSVLFTDASEERDMISSVLIVIISSVLIFYCLAGKTLRKEVRMVFDAADKGEEQARRQVSRIVGRDTSSLTVGECRTAALETLAENLSDGVIAPLFWLVLLGVPGMMTYKMINTLDSMVGYRNERYADFGCCSAKMDDIANFLPSRLTALLMIATYKILTMFMSDEITGVGVTHGSDAAHHRGFMELAGFVSLYGRNHLSPNSGWPEAALAGILDCRFGGGHYYFGEYVHKPYIGETARELTTEDMRLACRVSFLAETMSVTLLSVPFLLMLFFFVAAGGFPGKDTPCL